VAWSEVVLISDETEMSRMPCPPQAQAFLRPFVAGQKDVVVRGRDPGVLIFAGKE
jgi:hypothetical protein